jgi:asparagine synthase (glutamine-hydrolysing)
MCGISGIFSLNGQPVGRDEISTQIETMLHRGPDQGGVYVSPLGRCGLGIRRLRIIDVAGGQQPLSNEDDSLHLVYNGETYNYPTLQFQLEGLGHRPKTRSDGEVILHGYEAWGAAGILQKLRGMYAFALWDDHQQQLLLARDRFGIKPLYYARHADCLYFASEIKAILTQPDFPRRVNLPALEAMLTVGFVPGPETMFEGVYKLPPAHFLTVQHGLISVKKYWQLDYREDAHLSEPEAVEQFLALLRESVEIRLMSEVPLGALLSGGLDSGTLVALIGQNMAKCREEPPGTSLAPSLLPAAAPSAKLKTVSIGFEHSAYDETSPAQNLAEFIGTDHHPITFTTADFDDYPQVMYHLEEPQCSATAVPIYKLYQACRQVGLTVVLTGEGSDELLGGYHWHQGDARVRPLLPWPGALRQLLAASGLPMSAAARRVLRRGHRDLPARYQDWLEVSGGDFRHKLLSSEVAGYLSSSGPSLLTGWAEKLIDLRSKAPLHQTMWLETQTRLVDFINMEVDKLSMAHSIEARVPYLDHKLWEFCAGLPPWYKLKGRTEKYLLRRATKGILPDATRTRRKKGLASPYADWLRAERLPEWAEIALSPATIQRTGLFNPTVVQQLRQAHQAGQPNLGALLMGVLSTQMWYDTFI